MKLKEMYDELVQIARQIGIKVRKEDGKFRSGYCIVDEEEYIVLNRSNPIEVTTSSLARTLVQLPIDNIYIKPVVREFIEKERGLKMGEKEFQLEVEY